MYFFENINQTVNKTNFQQNMKKKQSIHTACPKNMQWNEFKLVFTTDLIS